MARKKKANKNDIGMAYRISGPKNLTKAQVFTAAIEAIRRGDGKLPKGVAITWKWRNSKKQAMREASFASAIKKSRAGFLSLMERRLTRDALATAPGFEAPPPIREATPAEVRAIERAERLTEEKRESKRQPGGTELARARETATKRSAAAKKGWATRRAAAAAKKRSSAKRKRK